MAARRHRQRHHRDHRQGRPPGHRRRSTPTDRAPIRPLGIEGIRQVTNRRGARTGIAYLRPHDLRRTLAARGMPIQDIRIALRHETLTATHAYLADNPLRVHRRLQQFTVNLDKS